MRNDEYASIKIFALFAAMFCAALIVALSCSEEGNPASTSSGAGSDGVVDTLVGGGNLWMAKNLDIAVDSSWCYNNNPENCVKYGRLYSWNAAQSVCLLVGEGWRLPSMAEWQRLIDSAGGRELAGRKLKDFTGWGSDNVIDSLDSLYLVLDSLDSMQLFRALPGGYRHQSESQGFQYIGYYGFWWSSGEHRTEGGAGYEMMHGNTNSYVNTNFVDKRRGYSVRCVKDTVVDTTRRISRRRL